MRTVLGICLLLASVVIAGPLVPSAMENGDRIEVTEHSTGCFHNTISYYEISKNAGRYSFAQYAISWDKKTPPTIVEKKEMGRIEISGDDVIGLDALFGFYRGKKSASSTTQVSLLVEYFEPGGKVGVEKLFDESGGFELEKIKGVVTFDALSQRLRHRR